MAGIISHAVWPRRVLGLRDVGPILAGRCVITSISAPKCRAAAWRRASRPRRRETRRSRRAGDGSRLRTAASAKPVGPPDRATKMPWPLGSASSWSSNLSDAYRVQKLGRMRLTSDAQHARPVPSVVGDRPWQGAQLRARGVRFQVHQVAGACRLEQAARQRFVPVVRRVGLVEAVPVGPGQGGVGLYLLDQRVAVSGLDVEAQPLPAATGVAPPRRNSGGGARSRSALSAAQAGTAAPDGRASAASRRPGSRTAISGNAGSACRIECFGVESGTVQRGAWLNLCLSLSGLALVEQAAPLDDPTPGPLTPGRDGSPPRTWTSAGVGPAVRALVLTSATAHQGLHGPPQRRVSVRRSPAVAVEPFCPQPVTGPP